MEHTSSFAHYYITDSPASTAGEGVGRARRTDTRLTVLLVDPHPMTRSCISSLLQDVDSSIQVHGFQATATARLDRLTMYQLVVWNLGSLRITDAALAEELELIRSELPNTPLALISKQDDTQHALDAARLGAQGFIPFSMDSKEMVEALRLIANGGRYVGPLNSKVARPSAHPPEEHDMRLLGADWEKLTRREADVYSLLIQGKPNKLIAHELEIAENTVKVHVHRIMKKLQLINRTEAAGAFASSA